KAVLRGRGWRSMVDGWQVSGTIFARTGFPYTVFDFVESGNLVANNYFGGIYAVPIGLLSSGPACGKGAAIPLAPLRCQPPQFCLSGCRSFQSDVWSNRRFGAASHQHSR